MDLTESVHALLKASWVLLCNVKQEKISQKNQALELAQDPGFLVWILKCGFF